MTTVLVREGKSRRQLELGARLGGGGEGTAYELPARPDSAAKIYTVKENTQAAQLPRRRQKILSMLAYPPRSMTVRHDGTTLPLLAWPTHLVESEERGFSGFLMPFVPESTAVRFTEYLQEIAAPRLLPGTERCLPSRLSLCCSLAGIVAELHRQGHFVVDFKPENLRVFHKGCIPCLLDNDSFSISGEGGKRFPATAFSPDYASPELLEQSAPEQIDNDAQDRFALAVLIFQVLNRGIHPFQGRRVIRDDEENTIAANIRRGLYAYGLKADERVQPLGTSAHHCLLPATRALFDQAFSVRAERRRPSAEEWRKHFKHILNVAKPFEKCARFSDDVMHIHFKELPCAECGRLQLTAQAKQKAPTREPRRWGRRLFKYAVIAGAILFLIYLLNQ